MVSALEIPMYPERPCLTERGGLEHTGTRIGAGLGSAFQGLLLGTGLQTKSISFCLQCLNIGNSNQTVVSPQKELSNRKILKSKSFLP